MVEEGAVRALDKIFRNTRVEYLSGLQEPEQLTERPKTYPLRTPFARQPQGGGLTAPPPPPLPVQQTIPPPPQQQEVPSPVEKQKDYQFQVEGADGKKYNLTLKPDMSVWDGGTRLGKYVDGEFMWADPSIGQKLLGGVMTGLKVANLPFTEVGKSIFSVIEASQDVETQRQQKQLEAELEAIRVKYYGRELKGLRQATPQTNPEYFAEINALQEKYQDTRLTETKQEQVSRVTEAYEQLPWWEQLLYEAPAFAVLGGVTIGGTRAGLAKIGTRGGFVGGLARGGAAVLKPAEFALETAPKAIIGAVAKPLTRTVGKATRTGKVILEATEAEQIKAAKTKLVDGIKAQRKIGQEVKVVKAAELSKRAAELEVALEGVTTEAERRAVQSKILSGKIIPDVELAKLGLNAKENALVLKGIKKSEEWLGLNAFERNRALESFFKLQTGDRLVPNEIKLLERLLNVQLPKKMTAASKGILLAREILGFPRKLIVSVDNSIPLRQAALLTIAKPTKSAQAYAAQFRILAAPFRKGKSFKGEVRAIARELRRSEFGALREDAGLRISEAFGDINSAEELFASKFIEKIPVVGKLLKPIFEVSEGLGTVYLNTLRANTFDSFARLYADKWSTKQFKQLARAINIGTGRGVMPFKSDVAKLLSDIFFAPRLVASRLQIPFLPLMNAPKEVRLETLGWIVKFVGANLGLMQLLKTGGVIDGWETDSRSSDFMKIKIGNTRIDPWAGMQQWVVFFSRMITEERKGPTGAIEKTARGREIGRMARGKLSPVVSMAWDLIEGKTFIGEEISTKPEDVQREIRNRFVPLFLQDVWDALDEGGLTGGISAAPGFVGMGVQSYHPRILDDWAGSVQSQTGKELSPEQFRQVKEDYQETFVTWADYENTPSRLRLEYLRKNPQVDAEMYFWGKRKEVQTPEATEAVEKLAKKYGVPLEALPIRTEEDYDTSGKDEQEIYDDAINMMPTYMAEAIYNGDLIIPEEKILSVINTLQDWRKQDIDLYDYYDLIMKGKSANERKLYRARNPELEAAMNFWGWDNIQSTQTAQSRSILSERAKLLDMDYRIIPGFAKKTVSKSTSFPIRK